MTHYNSDDENDKYNEIFYTTKDADFKVIVKNPDYKKNWYIRKMEELWKIGIDYPVKYMYSEDLDVIIANYELMLQERDSIRMSFRRYIRYSYNIYRDLIHHDYHARYENNTRIPRLREFMFWNILTVSIPTFLIASITLKIIQLFHHNFP